jgi:hypothetical protein
MKMSFNILLMIFTQIALLIAFNIMNQVDWWMIVLLLTPLIILAIHFLLKKMLGKGLFFLEQSKVSAQMNYVNLQDFNKNAMLNSTTNKVNKNAIAQVNSATNRFNNALQSVNAAADNLANAAANNSLSNNTMTNAANVL